MKKGLGREEISRRRQEVSREVEKLREFVLKAFHGDLLFGGIPAEVYRTCGKKNCRCLNEGKRHGPYKVIQVWKEKRSRQVVLKKSEGHYFEMAHHYVYQKENRKKVIHVQKKILEFVDAMLKRRTIWEKK